MSGVLRPITNRYVLAASAVVLLLVGGVLLVLVPELYDRLFGLVLVIFGFLGLRAQVLRGSADDAD